MPFLNPGIRLQLKTTTTVIIHSRCYENHVSSPMMGIMIKLRFSTKLSRQPASPKQ